MCRLPYRSEGLDGTIDDTVASIDATFVHMMRAFARTGGMTNGYPAGRQPLPPTGQSFAPENGPLISFLWEGRVWIPRFQFDPTDRSIRSVVKNVVAELSSAFDGWQLAVWFSTPNLWIGDYRPVDMIDSCPECLLGAARADRFIAMG
jgi:hypothetical protein